MFMTQASPDKAGGEKITITAATQAAFTDIDGIGLVTALDAIPAEDSRFSPLQRAMQNTLSRTTFFIETFAEIVREIFSAIPQHHDMKTRGKVLLVLLAKTCQFPDDFGKGRPGFSQEIINTWWKQLRRQLAESTPFDFEKSLALLNPLSSPVTTPTGSTHLVAAHTLPPHRRPVTRPRPVPQTNRVTVSVGMRQTAVVVVSSGPPPQRGWGTFFMRALCCCCVGSEARRATTPPPPTTVNPMLSHRKSQQVPLSTGSSAAPV